MTNANRVRIGLIVSAAFATATISASAAAQPPIDPQACEDLAWRTCKPDPSTPWTVYEFRCWNDTYEACMNGEINPFASLDTGPGRLEALVAAAVRTLTA